MPADAVPWLEELLRESREEGENELPAPEIEQRMRSILDAIVRVRPTAAPLPRPQHFGCFSDGGELTWAEIGMMIMPEFAVIFRPALPAVADPKPGEEWSFRLPGDEDKLAAAVWQRLKP